jgi:aryl-phospho-beta-D-glucosidase BglC (GH1 family)
MDKKTLQSGINLGGWLSQYPTYDHRHFKTFIAADDIKRIAGWGMDHVRLPVDYPVLEDDGQLDVYKASGFDYIESCLTWCQQNGLRLILDLHKAPGYSFDALDESSLFGNIKLQERFLGLWEAITRHFASRMNDGLAFELLNEIVLPDSNPWNALVKQAVARIHTIDPQRLIVVGGNHYNAVNELKNLDVIADPKILYTFHFYIPMVVTHQKAPWVPALVAYNQQVDYPGKAPRLEDFLKNHPEHQSALVTEVGMRFDKDYLRSMLQPALDFSQRSGQPVYCGEYGVYEGAPMPTRQNWTRDLVTLLNEFSVGRAYWSYKAMDFGLVDKNGQVVNRELIEIVSKR